MAVPVDALNRACSHRLARAEAHSHEVLQALHAWLADLGISNLDHRGRLLHRLLAGVPASARPDFACAVAERRLSEWFASMLPCSLPASVAGTAGRAAWLVIGGGRRFATELLPEAPSRALGDALRRATPVAQPPEQPMAMPAQSLAAAGWREWLAGGARSQRSVAGERLPWRRLLVLGGAVLATVAATAETWEVFSDNGITVLQVLLVLLFAVNFLWIAPVMMLIQTRLVVDVLRGRDSGWKPQRRDDGYLSWSECRRRHRGHLLAGLSLTMAAVAVSPSLLLWMSPALAGLLLAAPLSWLTASHAAGLAARRLGLFVIPEEIEPPRELRRAVELQADPGMSMGPRSGSSPRWTPQGRHAVTLLPPVPEDAATPAGSAAALATLRDIVYASPRATGADAIPVLDPMHLALPSADNRLLEHLPGRALPQQYRRRDDACNTG